MSTEPLHDIPAPSLDGFSGRELATQLDQVEAAPAVSVEQTGRPIEIIHYPHTDIILNHTARLASWGPKLAEVCQNGVPDTWTTDPHKREQNLVIGDVEGKRFIAKQRAHRLEAEEIAELRGLSADQAQEPVFLSYFSKRDWYAFESLANEIRLAPRIRSAAQSQPMQQLVQNAGFAGLSYIEPLLGIIRNAQDPQQPVTKSMVYEYIPGTMVLDSPMAETKLSLNRDQGGAVTSGLRANLKAAGLNPADLHTKHILVDNDRRLYLIDTEAYTTSQQSYRPAQDSASEAA